MFLTNPKQEQFKAFAITQLSKHKFSEKDLENNLVYRKTADYIFFSTYIFEINDYGIPMQGKYIGVLGGFYSLGSFTTNESQ